MVRERKEPVEHSAQYYEEQEGRRTSQRKKVNLWGKATRIQMKGERLQWNKFCKFRGWEPISTLLEANAEKYVSYLDRCLARSSFVQCRSSVRTKWKALSMLYRREAKEPMPDNVFRILKSNLHPEGYLVKKYNLNLKGRPKPVLYIDDFLEVLSCLWRSNGMHFAHEDQRSQLWLFEHISGYSGSRPGSLVNASRGPDFEPVDEFDNGASEPALPTYNDCTLTLLPNPEAGHRGVWVLEIEMSRTKGGLGLIKPNTYLFHSNPCLALCPITSFLTMAFGDQAFEAPDLTSPERLYSLVVEPGLRQRRVTWKESVLDTPLFRGADGQALRYATLAYQLRTLGKATGFKEVMTSYCLRRGTANSINGQTSDAIQNQILGHSSTRIYDEFYRDRKVQCIVQDAFVGVPSDDQLLKTANLMSRTIDPRTPRTLSKAEIAGIEQASQELQLLILDSSYAREQCIQKYVKLKEAKGTSLHERYVSAQKHVRNLSRRLQKEALAAKQEQFEKFAAVDDVQRQIQGLPSTVPNISDPVAYFHPERTRVAAALFARAVYDLGSDEDVARRVATLTDLIALRSLREPRLRPSLPASINELASASVTTEDESAMIILRNTLSELPSYDAMRLGDLCPENSVHENFDITSPSHSDCPAATQEIHLQWHQSPSQGLPFNEFMHVDIPDVFDTHEPGPDLLFTDFVNTDMCVAPTRLGSKTCLICYFDVSLGAGRTVASKFARQDSMQRHARLLHFRKGQYQVCPDSACAGQVFDHLDHFKNHAETDHGVLF